MSRRRATNFSMLLSVLLVTLMTNLETWGTVNAAVGEEYEPTWESLNAHAVPEWFEDAKFGLFIHWGVYSVPAWAPVGEYAEWYWHSMKQVGSPTWNHHRENYGENFTYDDFIPMFRAENYDPDEWVSIAKDAGMKYIVITTKHHDGFCLWPSDYTTRDAGEIGPKRDLIRPLVEAARRQGLKIGFYYSLLDWWHPDYPNSEYIEYVHNQVEELVGLYHPDMLWLDGQWDYPVELWKTRELIAWYYNQAEDPDEVCVNDRLGQGTRGPGVWGVYGDFATPEYEVMDEITDYKWESCRGIGYSFGYNRAEGPDDYMSAKEIINLLVDVVSKNGNLLLDVGPMTDGTIPEIQRERLEGVGEWLTISGEAVYATRPWLIAEEGNLRFTKKGDTVHVISFGWPGEELALRTIRARNDSSVRMLGVDEELEWRQDAGALTIVTPSEKPSDYAYVFKIQNAVPALFVVRNLVASPNVVEAGKPLEISVDVTNLGQTRTTQTVDLKVTLRWRDLTQKRFTENATLTLDSGETKTYTFELVVEELGAYELEVNGMVANFEVVEPEGVPEAVPSALLNPLTTAAVATVVIIVLVGVSIRRRKRLIG